MTSCAICGRPLTWIDDLFSRTVHDTCGEMYGYIGHFKLSEWWFSSFDEDERQYIELAFMPLGLRIVPAASGRIANEHSLLTASRGLQVYGRAGSFLANLAELATTVHPSFSTDFSLIEFTSFTIQRLDNLYSASGSESKEMGIAQQWGIIVLAKQKGQNSYFHYL